MSRKTGAIRIVFGILLYPVNIAVSILFLVIVFPFAILDILAQVLLGSSPIPGRKVVMSILDWQRAYQGTSRLAKAIDH
ncbi:hypothetical protein [Salinibaculum marinum]|uniref:hypothetical protein n=1 Tax=Salinibaculum marinum TaxID=3131993 RepID=UPI0030D31213